MQQNYLIDFRGPALTLEQVAEKARYVANTFAGLRSKNKDIPEVIFCLVILTLCVFFVRLQGGHFSPYINPVDPIVVLVVSLLVLFLYIALVIYFESITEKAAAAAFGDEQIYFTWLSKASKDEMLKPAKSLADLKLFKKIMDHPVGGEFSGYIRGVLQQRDMTAYEQHFLKREFEAAEEQHDKEVALKDAEALRALLVSGPSQ